ncbi:hypothetical protein BJF92_01010 [Rhizobium rhizosphaerae]|uniref:DUF883 domain-containing protein n=1 Tax=Xaviernesmea rhizosphaerae TaxID=1672749 RepID=A0A1Q9AEK1_9HYPH|nr:hypothetical protein [Xaviernesmea rhizosphaerae]OLP53372.1 hypothetical protein BJF92_01010 [Xaviernesmea rhizosphaerae]OQP84918.1 hypothetical protein BTR14_17595 [Xaviernesmea rhizosphaerae]
MAHNGINPEQDINALRDEVARLSKIVSAQGAKAYSDTRAKAEEALEAAAPAARNAVRQVKAEGQAIAEVAREHPAATGSVLALTAALGLLVGYVIGAASQPQPSYTKWWR